jgi:hypothetical protein
MAARIGVWSGLAGALLVASVAIAEEERFRVGSGSLPAPGTGWETELAPDGEVVRFTKLHKWLGQAKGSTQIVVFRNEVAREAGDDPSAIAAAFFASEERIMRESGVAAGDYELSGIEQGTHAVGERTLYTFAYRKKLSTLRYGRKDEQARLSVWFPEDFPTSREFYGFLIAELRQTGALVTKPDLRQIDRVIDSFRLERASD